MAVATLAACWVATLVPSTNQPTRYCRQHQPTMSGAKKEIRTLKRVTGMFSPNTRKMPTSTALKLSQLITCTVKSESTYVALPAMHSSLSVARPKPEPYWSTRAFAAALAPGLPLEMDPSQ
jgi:hypothetical protein